MIGLKDNRALRLPRQLSDEGMRRRRERAAEEARWEAQLRAAARARPKTPPVRAVPEISPVRTMLDVVDGMTRYDNLVIPRALPLAIGCEDEDLACGTCGETIAAQSSRDSVRRSHPQGDRLVIRCTCRALNVICGAAGRSNRRYFRQRMPARRAASAKATITA